MNYGTQIAKFSLELNAIKLSPDKPFTWASGYKMPIYNDNRTLLGVPHARRRVKQAFIDLIREEGLNPEVVEGVATAGIPWGTLIAEELGIPFGYVRSKSKEHGLENKLEGANVEGKDVIVVEDLISTGKSSINAIKAIRNADGNVTHCLAIFDYGFDEAKEAFGSLTPECKTKSIFNYDILLEVASEAGYISEEDLEMLKKWRKDPFQEVST